MRPLPDVPSDPAVEPRLGLVADEPEAEEAEAENEEGEEEEADAPDARRAETTQDPLKLYVRAIGDGPLLAPSEQRALPRRREEGDQEAEKKQIERHLR